MQYNNLQHQSTFTKKNVGYNNVKITLLLSALLSPSHQLPMLIHCCVLARRQFGSIILYSPTTWLKQHHVLLQIAINSCYARYKLSILYKTHHCDSLHVISGTGTCKVPAKTILHVHLWPGCGQVTTMWNSSIHIKSDIYICIIWSL